MHTFLVDESRIAEVERGRSSQAVVLLPPGGSLLAGDAVLFAALSASRSGRPPSYVPGGDSIVVSLTRVIDLGTTDPVTGGAHVQLNWNPLGREEPSKDTPDRAGKPRRVGRGA